MYPAVLIAAGKLGFCRGGNTREHHRCRDDYWSNCAHSVDPQRMTMSLPRSWRRCPSCWTSITT